MGASSSSSSQDSGHYYNLHEDNCGGTAVLLPLTPTQSCSLHGWANPKRTLSWDDVARNHKITLRACVDQGIALQDLHEMQPDLSAWIARKRVSFEDVPLMATHWRLHPIVHLKGDISDLASMHYAPRVLQQLGITYRYMREQLRMDDDWMRMLRYRPAEWKEYLGFGEYEADQMGDARLEKVFMMDPGLLRIAMNAAAAGVAASSS